MSKSLVKTLVVIFLVCVFEDVAQNIESFTDDDNDDDIGNDKTVLVIINHVI